MTLLTPEVFYIVVGLILLAVAWRRATRGRTADEARPRDSRFTTLFWVLLAATFILGKRVPSEVTGALVVAMVLLAAAKRVAPVREPGREAGAREASARALGNRLLVPPLVVPVVVIAGGLVLARIGGEGWRLVLPAQASAVALGLGCVAGLVAALRVTRSNVVTAVDEGGRLLAVFGWALLLPQMLAALGGIFSKAGVGQVVADAVAVALPMQWPWMAVIAYCAGMTLFTVVMGNAFAAFPVVTLGIGIPFVVRQHGGDPAILGALGMLSGYCGTLLTPMAANFNVVPAMLLEIDDPKAIYRAQRPFAIGLWIFNVLAMGLLVYRFRS